MSSFLVVEIAGGEAGVRVYLNGDDGDALLLRNVLAEIVGELDRTGTLAGLDEGRDGKEAMH